jgi:hypothetical protein
VYLVGRLSWEERVRPKFLECLMKVMLGRGDYRSNFLWRYDSKNRENVIIYASSYFDLKLNTSLGLNRVIAPTELGPSLPTVESGYRKIYQNRYSNI